MLTISQDWIVTDTNVTEHAIAGDLEVFANSGATCVLADMLLQRGHSTDEQVVLLRADPWLFPAPHRISGLSLETVSRIDFFKTCPKSLFEEMLPFLEVTGT